MKQFIGKILFFFGYCVVLLIIIPMLIDPYNIFHADNLRDNGIEPNKNYIKMKYILSYPDRYNCYLFGSSRVGSIHVEKMPSNEHCYNMTYSEGLPKEHLDNICTLLDNGIIPSKIYLGVDSLSYTLNAESHKIQPLQCPYEYAEDNLVGFLELYFNPYIAICSLPTSYRHEKEIGYTERFYQYGWWCNYGRKTEVDWSKTKASIGKGYYMEETIEDIKEIVQICKKEGIELTVFTNPMYISTYEASLDCDYLEFLLKLSDVTEFYNFSGINDVTINQDNYIDTSHYKAEIGDMMLECMCNNKVYDTLYDQGFGMYITHKNIDELIEKLK